MSKIDAARRQLETAVWLYFQAGDDVSIHTLAAAAHEIIAALLKKAGTQQPMIRDLVLGEIKTEYREAFNDRIREPQNFFKHAGRDAFGTLEGFSLRQSEMLMIDACLAYPHLTQERPPLVKLFTLWARLTFAKNWLSFDDESVLGEVPELMTQLAAMTREAFFATMEPIALRSPTK